DEALVPGAPELDGPVAEGEDRVVASEPGAWTGAELRPTLPDDDHPRLHLLAGEDLHAEPLRLGVASVPRGPETFLMRHLRVPFLLRERRLECRDGALALRVRLLVLKRCFEHRPVPLRDRGLDVRDRHLLVARRHALDALLCRSGLGLRLRTTRRFRATDRFDLDLREGGAEARVAPVARALLVLADPDLRALRVTEDLGGHDSRVGLELCRAVASDEEDGRSEGRALVLA